MIWDNNIPSGDYYIETLNTYKIWTFVRLTKTDVENTLKYGT